MTMPLDGPLPDWEAFYRDYRKPGYVAGFEITSKLGGGMFGLVFRARRMSIGKDYAIKFLQVEDETVQKAVLAELEQVKWFAQIDHPNLVSIEDRGEVDGIPFLVMAFAGTETLRDRMPAGRAPSPDEKDELLRYFLQACRGLAALHERSLVHFDVKPANVFLKGGVARVGDYGLSKLVTHNRGSLSMGRGTPYYMAPELLQRRGDHRSDVYSLGVLLYELLCGRVPFTGDSEWEVLKQHETKQPELPDHLTARERAVLQRCLHKDPAARFQSVHDLIAACGEHASREPFGSSPLPRSAPPPLPAADGVPLQGCVAPPLPRAPAATARRPQRQQRGTFARPLAIVLGLLVTALVVLPYARSRESRRLTTAYASAPPAPQPRRATSPPARFEQLVGTIQRSVRLAAQRERRTALGDVDGEQFAMPRDFRAYRDQVLQLARAPAFSTGLATKVERLGRPAFVAGVDLLHGFDYDDPTDCRRAANVHKLLGRMAAVEGLELPAVGAEPCESDVCRALAIADGWRRIAEEYARSDASWQQLLAFRGKRTGSQR
jgi:hypothetical protein